MNEFWYSVFFAAVIGIGVHLIIRSQSFAISFGIFSILLSFAVSYYSWKSFHSLPEQPVHVLLSDVVSKLPLDNFWIIIDDINWDCSQVYYINRANADSTYIMFSNHSNSYFGVATFNSKITCNEISNMEVSGIVDYMSSKRMSFLEKNGISLANRQNVLEYCTYCGKNNSKIGIISGVFLFACGLILIIEIMVERFIKKRHY